MSDLRSRMLRVLPPFEDREKMIDPNQTTRDIVKEVLKAHQVFESHYDKIADIWTAGELNKVPKKLFQFCADHLKYKEEDADDQTTRSPAGILELIKVDCKHYSGFMAGVLDAINRTGEYYYDWYYRFASEEILDASPHHVFVVVKGEDETEVWLDPVPNVGGYDTRPIYFWKYDKRPKGMALRRLSGTGQKGFVSHTTVSRSDINAPMVQRPVNKIGYIHPLVGYQPGAKIGANQDAEKALQDALKAYEEGLITSVSNLKTNSSVDGNIDAIVKSAAASAVPGASAALAITSTLTTAVSNIFGAGSVLSRVAAAASSGNVLTTPINIVKAIVGGRSYYLDKYYLFNDYSYHVLGYSSGGSDGVSDSDVPVACQWFITKLGIFISSRTFLGALRDGVDNYMALIKVNPYTTQDRVRVQLAYNVLQQYMPNVLTPKNWANTVGVYDNAVTAAIVNARRNNPAAQADTTGTNTTGAGLSAGTAGILNYIQANPLPSILIGAGLAYGAYQLLKD